MTAPTRYRPELTAEVVIYLGGFPQLLPALCTRRQEQHDPEILIMCRYRKNQVQLSVTIQVAGKEKTEPSIVHLRFPDNPLSVQQQTVILVDVLPFRLCL